MFYFICVQRRARRQLTAYQHVCLWPARLLPSYQNSPTTPKPPKRLLVLLLYPLKFSALKTLKYRQRNLFYYFCNRDLLLTKSNVVPWQTIVISASWKITIPLISIRKLAPSPFKSVVPKPRGMRLMVVRLQQTSQGDCCL
jgi:hypothetical protein